MSYHHLTLEERKMIAQMTNEECSQQEIALVLNRSPSTISREKRRNISSEKAGGSGRIRHRYRYRVADKKYQDRLHARRGGKYEDRTLTGYVQEKLLRSWSPEQVAGRIGIDYPHNPQMRISHSTIYRWLHNGLVDQAAAIKLRHHGHRHGETRGKGKFTGIRKLSERCKEACRRERFGDMELDTMVSSSSSDKAGVLCLVDRKTRYSILILLRRVRSSNHVYNALAAVARTTECLSFTADRGTEFGCFKDVENKLKIPMFFCDPHSPWQKGTVENNNGLAREFFPNGTNFSNVSEYDVSRAMDLLNNRPKKCLGWMTPAEASRLHLT